MTSAKATSIIPVKQTAAIDSPLSLARSLTKAIYRKLLLCFPYVSGGGIENVDKVDKTETNCSITSKLRFDQELRQSVRFFQRSNYGTVKGSASSRSQETMTIIFEDKLVDQIIEADGYEPVEGQKGAVMVEFENEDVSVEVIPYLNEWGAVLVLSNNFTVEKHSQHFIRIRDFLERKLGIMGFNIFGSHGETLNGYDFERQYLTDRHKGNLEFESIMIEWENQRRQLERK
jgi:hypothetical protein